MHEYAETRYGEQADAGLHAYGKQAVEERESIMVEMTKALDQHAHVITTLESRLGPVSRPDYEAEKALSQPRDAQSAIRDLHEGLIGQTARLQRLLSRLEV